MARARLAQHFLADASWRERILETLTCRPDDVWLEIGAGHGEMTRELARRAARVVAVEADARLVASLRALEQEAHNLQIVAGDILEQNLAQLAGDRFKLYGNLPYYITSPILRKVFAHADQIEEAWLVMQLEVAARLVARPGRRAYGLLSVLTQYYFRAEIRLRLPPGAFRPRPKVASALVHLKPPGHRTSLDLADQAGLLAFVAACFAQKRKTLRNNLRAWLGAQKAEALLKATGLAGARAEQLELAQFATLFREAERLRGA